jgi:uncharacterized protein with HEPN domain
MVLDDPLYLEHIDGSIKRIMAYVESLELPEFKSRPMVQDAVIRQLEIIGEATKHISDDLRHANPEIPWANMAGMRDRLIHGYFDMDLDEVWLTVDRDLPSLL